jgi:hypothetical protein
MNGMRTTSTRGMPSGVTRAGVLARRSAAVRQRTALARFWLVAVLAGVSAVASGVAPAAAQPPLRVIGAASTGFASGSAMVASDGGRVAYMPAPGRVRVIDETLAEVASSAEPGCTWRAFGGGALLWNCEPLPPARPSGYSLIDELDGSPQTVLQPPIGLGFGGHGETASWWGIGSRWLIATFDGESNVYVNRPTGSVDYRRDLRSRGVTGLVTDVDQADLTRRVCAPLARHYVEGSRGASVAVPLAYRPPYGATRSGSRLLMARCGARRLTVLSRCPRSCSDPVVGDGFVAWMAGRAPARRTLDVRLIDRRRSWRWQMQPSSLPSDHLIAALGRRLFVLDGSALKTIRLPTARALR